MILKFDEVCECSNKHANTFYLDILFLLTRLSFETSDALATSEFPEENLNRMLYAHLGTSFRIFLENKKILIELILF